MKRLFQAGLAICLLLGGAALWARQKTSPSPVSAAEIEHRVEAFLRNYYAWGSDFQVKVDAPAPSMLPDIYKVPVVVTYKGQSDHAAVWVTHDGHYIIRGTVSNLLVDPFAAAREKLLGAIAKHPYTGPAKACVNVVEFSDYECPHCAEAHDVMKQLELLFPKVRFTYVDFPLTPIHPWAMNAALAARCVFHQNPADFTKMRDEIFDNQDTITPDSAPTVLATFATQAGVNSKTVQACMASPATHKEIENDIGLGKSLGVDSTPTIFVNGRMVVGGSEAILSQAISYELAKCQPGPARK